MSHHPFNTAPGPNEAIPLRERLPNLSDTTGLLLVEWARRQPAVSSWILQRSAAYFDKLHPHEHPLAGDGSERAPNWVALDATAALDLLRWQSGCDTDLAAVVRLRDLDETAQTAKAKAK